MNGEGKDVLTIAAFTGGVNVPSARFRVRQLIPALLLQGVLVTEFASKFGAYPPATKPIRPLWMIGSLGARVPDIARSYRYDISLMQREMISTFDTLEFLTKRPRVLDVDDAIFLYRGGGFAARLAKQCELIICGNDYLAERFARWNQRVAIIPTGVDIERFVPRPSAPNGNHLVIGWIGTSSNFKQLFHIESALDEVLRSHPHSLLRVVADRRPEFRTISSERVSFIPWDARTEVESIQSLDIGIMPLIDSEWERGKCSYKMLQYMACALPVVVSPVGMNAQVLAMERVGIGASTSQEWRDALTTLLSDPVGRASMGQTGRRVVEDNFSFQAIVPKLAELLRGVTR